MSADRDELRPNDRIGDRYRVVGKLGAGGMGTVYEAVQEGLGRHVAVKVLRGAYAEDAEAITRFQREAHAAASLGHPNIVAVTDFGVHEGVPFMVMERLEGAPLSRVIASERALSPTRAAWIASQALSALAAAHRAGIVHRDIKPDNVFLTEVSGVRDVVKVLDFGVARCTDAQGASNLTATGAVLGTPAYMSPEQARGRVVDARTDLYAVGVLLYEMLSGRQPFQASNYHALLFAVLEETPPSLASLRPDLDPALVAVIERAMAKSSDARFQTADALRDALSSWLAHPTTDPYARTAEQPQYSPSPPAAVTSEPFAPGGAGSMFAAVPQAVSPQPSPAAPARVARSRGLWLTLVLPSVVALLLTGVFVVARSTLARWDRASAALRRQMSVGAPIVSAASPDASADYTAMLADLADASGSIEALVAAASNAQSEPRTAQPTTPSVPTRSPRGGSDPFDNVDYAAAFIRRRPVYVSLAGLEMRGAEEPHTRRKIEASMCATTMPSPGPSSANGWTVTYDVALNRSGVATEATARNQGPIPQMMQVCMRQVLLGIDGPLVRGATVPASIAVVLRGSLTR
jgi:serine/threonine-protein kinase